MLADGSTATLGRRRRGRAGPPRRRRTRWRRGSYRDLPRIWSRPRRTRSPPAFPRSGGAPAATGSTGSPAAPPFDLAKFLVGSEGTLAIVTAATVGLVPKPRKQVFAVGHFTSVQDAIAATEDALRCDPRRVELLDRTILDLSRRKIEYAGARASILEGDPEALLFVSFTGDDEAELVAALDRLAALWESNGHGYHTLRAVTPAQQSALLKVRKSALGLLMAASAGRRRPLAFVEDTAVAPGAPAPSTRPGSATCSTGTASRPASTATARSAACTSGRSST